MKKIEKISALVVVGMFVSMMLTPSVFAAPEPERELPYWHTEGNDAGKKDVLGTLNDRDLRIVTNGEQRMVITSEGNVGIGTANPQYKLDVDGDARFSGTLHIGDDGDPTLVVSPSGNVGIGVPDPQHELDVEGNVHTSGAFIAGSTTTYGDGFIDFSFPHTFLNIDNGALYIESAGGGQLTCQVGIGTQNPHNLLDLGSSHGRKLAVFQNMDGTDFYGFGISSGTLEIHAGNDGCENPGMVFTTQGRLGIGTTSPDVKLDVEVSGEFGSVGGAATIGYSGNSATGDYAIAMGYGTIASGRYSTAMGVATTASMEASTAIGYFTTASGDLSTAMGSTIEVEGDYSFGIGLAWCDPKWTITQPNTMAIMGGNVGIGTTSPSGKLEVVGDIIVSGTVDGVDIDVEVDALHTTDVDLQNQIDNLQGQIGSDTVKQLTQDFVVASGESVNAGDVVSFLDGYVQKGYKSEYVFTSAFTSFISAATLSPTKFVLAYRDESNSDYGTAVIGEVSGKVITYGSEYLFNTANSYYISVAALSSTKFVVVYSDYGNSVFGTAIIGEVSGNMISFGSPYVFNSGWTSGNSVAALSSTKFVVAYNDLDTPPYTQYGTAIIGDVSDSTIIFGEECVFNPALTGDISVAALSETKFVVAWFYGLAIIGEVSGNTITYGSEYTFGSQTQYISVAPLSSTKFIVAYMCGGGIDNYAAAIVGDVSDKVITFGSEYVFNLATTCDISAASLSPTKFVVAYQDYGNSEYGTAIIGDVSGDIITYGSEYVFNKASSFETSVAALSSTKFVVAYRDQGNSNFGTAFIGDVSIDGINIYHRIVTGIAREFKTAGMGVRVIIDGVSDVHSGLIPGLIYYSSESGDLTTEISDCKVGLAISSTEILLADPFF